jgi:hypothetical protein
LKAGRRFIAGSCGPVLNRREGSVGTADTDPRLLVRTKEGL